MLPLLFTPKLSYVRRILNSSPVAYWPLDDAAGASHAREIAGVMSPGSTLTYTNGDFETAGAGGADIFANWTEYPGTGTIADETTILHAGGHSVKVTNGGTGNTFVYAYIPVGPGRIVTFSAWCRGDGTKAGYVEGKDSAGNNILAQTTTGVTGLTWELKTFTCNPIPTGTIGAYIRLRCPNVSGNFCFFDDFSYSVSTSDGIASSGVQFGQPGVKGSTCVRVGASTPDFIDIFTPYFESIFDDHLGSLMIWVKVGVLSEWLNQANSGTFFKICYDTGNTITLARDIYQLPGDLAKGGHVNYYWIGSGVSTAGYPQVQNLDANDGWLCWAQTWSVAANQHLCYLNGVLQVTTNTVTAWASPPTVNATLLGLGAIATLSAPWNGYLAHAALWNKVLTPAEILSLY